MATDEAIKILQSEARRINAKAKKTVKESNQQWLEMDEEMLSDFWRYTEIKMEIEKLKTEQKKTR